MLSGADPYRYSNILQEFTTNSEFEFCGIFSDAGISGAKSDRPGLVAMMEKAKAGGVLNKISLKVPPLHYALIPTYHF